MEQPDQPDQPTIDRWHRWFAVEANNRAWDLTAAASRTPDEEREMRLAAYAAAFHWSKVGTPVNDMRAEMLLAHVHALSGEGQEALGYARRCLTFCESAPGEEWDHAFAHLEMALAAAAAGDAALHAEHHARARALGEALADAHDRQTFAVEFARIPVPASE